MRLRIPTFYMFEEKLYPFITNETTYDKIKQKALNIAQDYYAEEKITEKIFDSFKASNGWIKKVIGRWKLYCDYGGPPGVPGEMPGGDTRPSQPFDHLRLHLRRVM